MKKALSNRVVDKDCNNLIVEYEITYQITDAQKLVYNDMQLSCPDITVFVDRVLEYKLSGKSAEEMINEKEYIQTDLLCDIAEDAKKCGISIIKIELVNILFRQ